MTAASPTTGNDSRLATDQRGSDYAVLCRQVRAAGLLERRIGSYTVRLTVTLSLYALAWLGVMRTGDSWWQAVTAAALGIVHTQVAFLGHDAGHQQIFAERRANDRLGRVLGNALIGLSYGWWVGKHNRHHAKPNTEGYDPDIGDGVLVFTTGQVAQRTGRLGRAITRHQAWLFFPLLTLEGLNLHVASVLSLRAGGERSLRGGRRSTELLVLVAHLVVYLTVVLSVMSPLTALVFIAIHQGIWGLYMGCSFAPNHKGMPILAPDSDLDYLRRQVLTSRNVRGGILTDLLLGGLNYQIEHHLFPNLPRPSLRRVQRLVRAHCTLAGIPYHETSLLQSYIAALGYLDALGAELR